MSSVLNIALDDDALCFLEGRRLESRHKNLSECQQKKKLRGAWADYEALALSKKFLGPL